MITTPLQKQQQQQQTTYFIFFQYEWKLKGILALSVWIYFVSITRKFTHIYIQLPKV